MEKQSFYKTRMRAKGQITLPKMVRENLDVQEGDDLIFFENEEGQLVVEAVQIIPPDQAWFWTERWQKMERAAQNEIDAGREQEFESAQDAVKALNSSADAEN